MYLITTNTHCGLFHTHTYTRVETSIGDTALTPTIPQHPHKSTEYIHMHLKNMFLANESIHRHYLTSRYAYLDNFAAFYLTICDFNSAICSVCSLMIVFYYFYARKKGMSGLKEQNKQKTLNSLKHLLSFIRFYLTSKLFNQITGGKQSGKMENNHFAS